MKSLVTNLTVPNLQRLACTKFLIVVDEVTNAPKFLRVGIQARPTNTYAGTADDAQFDNSYPPVTLRITNSACQTYLPNPAENGSYNPYTDRFVKGTIVSAGLMDAVIAARNAANDNQKNNVTLLALAAAGVLPPLE
jgi:hypothetical protein